jgi:flavodoxin
MAQAISKATQAPIFDVVTSTPTVVSEYDVVIIGTPVEGFRPARETLAFVKDIPQAHDKKAILFCTFAIWRGTTFRTLSRLLGKKGYECILKVSKRKVTPGQTDFSEVAEKVKKALDHALFVNWFSSRSGRSKKKN